MARQDDSNRNEQRTGWFAEDAQGRRSYYSDSPEYVAEAAAEVADGDPERFEQLVLLDLEADERDMLICGLRDWGGPAYGSDALAVAMGFANMEQLVTDAQDLIDAIKHERALSIRDWTKALVATELAFASTVLGTGLSEWHSINGGLPERWIVVLERLQSKLPTHSDALQG